MTSGRSLVTAVLLALAFALFVPAFSQAASEFTYGSWAYGPEVAVVLEYLPVILATTALAVLAYPIVGGDRA